jgi:hypothetical protein
MNGVHQSEWASMNLGDSDMLSIDVVVSWDNLAALLALPMPL